jgi:ADP-heptose:LPS heptosyltransferase
MMKVKNVEIRNPNYRKGTFAHLREVVFDFRMKGEKTAALGDMICWLSAIKFVAEADNFVVGHLVVPAYFMEIAQNVLREYPHWRIHSNVPERLANGFPLQQPVMIPNATMMHLIDLGFIYFAGTNPPPEDFNFYCELDLDDIGHKFELPSKYAVMTPGATAKNRMMLPSTYNAICDHLLSKGITPVHLGVTEMDHRTNFGINNKYDLSKGINLIDKTSLMTAALIMEEAEMVIGIDNGLLHLAALTPATILYGFTVASPQKRQVRRRYGHTVEMYADKEKLPCLFCQDNVRFFIDHHFTNCIYKENEPACVKALNAESWNATIDMVLGEK